MRSTLTHTIGVSDDDTLSTEEILERIQRHFQRQRNVALRRVRRQRVSESFDDFYVSFKKLTTDANLFEQCIDGRLVTRVTFGIHDEQIRKRLLAIDPPPALSEVVSRSEESARKTVEELAGSGKAV